MKNRISKKSVLVLILVMVAVLLCFWRMSSKSLYEIISADIGTVNSIELGVTELGVKDGAAVMDSYTLIIDSTESEHYDAILSDLKEAQLRPDFRNLLPFKPEGADDIDSAVNLRLYLKDGNTESSYFVLNGDDKTISISDEDGFSKFHPVNYEVLEEMVIYIMEHGNQE